MAGASFLRADLHVHTYPDGAESPEPDLAPYVEAAVDNDIAFLAITDHNSVRSVRDALKAAEGTGVYVVPGIEISTQDGHLLALFDPDEMDRLEALAAPGTLKLRDLSPTEQRSDRSMLDLVEDIGRLGGIAIPAHVDAGNGAGSRLSPAAMTDLLTSPALAALEFATPEALRVWFSEEDPDENRRAAWIARQKISELKDRGLGRVMSSDAHAPDKVGRDRKSRTLTRLRVDSPSFVALRNAIALNPKARCKAETILPASYPRVLGATFEGGFLDGVELDFSDNLNCLIGGRGSGKSTALLSIRAALGARIPPDEDADDPDRMPEVTTVRFIDAAGSERTAIRKRNEAPTDPAGAPIRLRLADLGQEETGRLARGYRDDPHPLLEFLDGFVVTHENEEKENELLAALEENATDVQRSSGVAKQITELEKDEARLGASLKAATESRVEDIAKWAAILASEGPLLAELQRRLQALGEVDSEEQLSLDEIAEEYGVDLSSPVAAPHVDGADGLRTLLAELKTRREEIARETATVTGEAAQAAMEAVAKWQADHDDLNRRRAEKQAELEKQGLTVQAGAVSKIAERLAAVTTSLAQARKKQAEFYEALRQRNDLLDQLHDNREQLWLRRKATLDRIAGDANRYSDDVTIRVSFDPADLDEDWRKQLTGWGFKQPRVARLARKITPREFSAELLTATGRERLLDLRDDDGSVFFSADSLPKLTWAQRFELQTMRLHDRPRIEVQRRGEQHASAFDHLSAGQQRSVLLGLVLCAEQNEPLVLDQPEDHLDGQYIAESVVRHLEAAKERRQVIIATHSANLVVLGDAEYVIPMVVRDGKGAPDVPGAVDRSETRDRVCALLEGGTEAYKRRGQKYGFRFEQ